MFCPGYCCIVSLPGGLPRQRHPSDPGNLYDQVPDRCHSLPFWSTGFNLKPSNWTAFIKPLVGMFSCPDHKTFDFQRCSLKFASWTTEITRLNLSIGEPHLIQQWRTSSEMDKLESRPNQQQIAQSRINLTRFMIRFEVTPHLRRHPFCWDSAHVLGLWRFWTPTVLWEEVTFLGTEKSFQSWFSVVNCTTRLESII